MRSGSARVRDHIDCRLRIDDCRFFRLSIFPLSILSMPATQQSTISIINRQSQNPQSAICNPHSANRSCASQSAFLNLTVVSTLGHSPRPQISVSPMTSMPSASSDHRKMLER